jgi:hypothetical protein
VGGGEGWLAGRLEPTVKYHSSVCAALTRLRRGRWLVGSLTGAVAS